MEEIETIPNLGFARGAIVRIKTGSPNMLVVRGLGETTAVILCEGDDDEKLRLCEVPTQDLEQVLSSNQFKLDGYLQNSLTPIYKVRE